MLLGGDDRPAMPRVEFGAPAPWFAIRTRVNPTYAFSSIAGRFVLVAFLPHDRTAAEAIVGRLLSQADLFQPRHRFALLITRDEALFEAQADQPGVQWALDLGDEVARLYGAAQADGSESPYWAVLDPTLRGLWTGGWDELERLIGKLRRLPAPDDHAGTLLNAPVLIVPRVFEPAACRKLIEFYDTHGGAPSGVMREIGGKTVGVLDDFKKRRDAIIEDEAVQRATRWRIHDRLMPEIWKAFQFKATRMERYIVAAYDAQDGGYFLPHRDNTTAGTAHRQFACSINLNDDFDGGDLRFPEFGSRTYRPPVGGAVVFSCSLLHEATPVTRGRRYAFLPFFYDEASAVVRKANRSLVVDRDATPQEASADRAAE
jgi:predicted 2-oxoglutarate/Fe(II)-dependent dioxygenase YbiX